MKILFATDGSECSVEAAERVAALLPLDKAELLVISVAPMPVATDVPSLVGTPYVDYSLLADEIREEAERHADQARAIFEAKGAHPATRVVQGDAAGQILDIARTERPDLIVVGSHGRTGFRRLLLGSVSQRVVSDAACPVMVIKSGAS